MDNNNSGVGLPDRAVIAGHDFMDHAEHETEQIKANTNEMAKKSGVEATPPQKESKMDKVKEALHIKK